MRLRLLIGLRNLIGRLHPTSLRRALSSLVAALALAAGPARAGLVVVVSADSPIPQLSRNKVIDVFMGRHQPFRDRNAAHPLDAHRDSRERRIFYRRLLDKSLEEIDAYRSLMMFAGHTSPPRELPNPAAVVEAVVADPLAIGYVDASVLTPQLKVVFSLPE